ncbi:MAG: DUF4097 family beta strand repeat-containing protein [Planctomycetota bacterium]
MNSTGLTRLGLIGGLLAAGCATAGCIIVVDGKDGRNGYDGWSSYDEHGYRGAKVTKRNWSTLVRSEDLETTESIAVETHAGDIVLMPTEGQPKVRAAARGLNKERVRDVEVVIEPIDGELRIAADWPGGERRHHESIDLVIEVPERFGVAIQTEAGDVIVESMAGPLAISTSAGDVEVEAHEGPARVLTSAGDIEMRSIAGSVDAETSAGDIDLHDVGWPVEAHTSAGDITVAMRYGFAGTMRASTSAGSIELPGTGTENRMGGMKTATHTIGGEDAAAECVFATSAGDIDVRVLKDDG